ncbi:multidrug effflux MFS transporter [Sinorhizobium fredii]|uniref:MFS transporter n=1 Tax=Rhizobium fredii TaxID=380 RepID=A0A844ALG1_RHIFR|nr:multidrug effflux MFS transporter [Sinorhizobium fredii]AWM24136.1 MFS family multidrug efflux protein similarity to bicyclomycin resistance protein Bcr [Sinorhizobium fredii CCBAU 25509]MQW99666.1 MFS transporter [Sinorhizobium fredii]MQX12997.1 MFS transporter [Sinorhizobium fredii]UTY48593.1 MFS transporter [Sinorhizobium fredii]GEC34231.1 MFS transporter [Sinorhizobium fredii]
MISFRERISLYALLTSLTSLSIDALLPGLREIGADVGVAPPLSTQHVISLFIFGMAFGELLLGPLSDAIGRKKALLLGLCVYVAGTFIAMLAGSLEMVTLGRFLQGVGVSGPKIATRAMIRDQFEGDAMARVMSFMFTLFILVPMLAPALAQGLIGIGGWRSVFGAYLAIAGILGLWLVVRQPETLPATRRIPFRPSLLFLNGRRILSNRRVALLIVATGIVFGAQLLYLSTAADLFFDAYDIKETFPFYFAVLATGIGLASFVNAKLVQRFGMETMARAAFMGLASTGFLMTVTSMLWGGRLPLPALMIFVFVAFFAIGVLFGNLNAMAMRSLGQVAGLGASLIASGSSLVATLFAIGMGSFYDGTAVNLSVGFFAAGASALVLAEVATRSDMLPIEAIR